jgi:copper transport protein
MTTTRRDACLRGAGAVLAFGVLRPRPGAAHSLLTASMPAEGQVLAAPPAEIVLGFNEGVRLTALRLLAQDGTERPLRRMRDMAPRAEHRAGIGEDLPLGAWRVVWRAISADGHEIGGTLRFRLEAAR